jgi:ribonuclease HIII
MQRTFSFNLSADEDKKVLKFLKQSGEVRKPSNPYISWHVKGGSFSAIMYKSGKFVLQTSDINLKENISKEIDNTGEKFQPRVGSDEVGKGDFFGPLVVCSCYVSNKELQNLRELGVMDSKRFKDFKIIEIAKKLKENLRHKVKVITPKEYNLLVEECKNVSILLARAHIEVLENLVEELKKDGEEVDFVVVDQFSKNKKRLTDEFKMDIPLRQFHKGESDIAVACASILARYYFLLEFEKMNEQYDRKFPLGATHVISFGKDFVKDFGIDELEKVAKVSFRTMESIKK